MVTVANDLVAALQAVVSGDVLAGTAGEDDHDASHFRLVPAAVVRAAHRDDLAATVSVARDVGATITMRGGGTSLAGQAVGSGIVLDTRALAGIAIDAEAQSAVVGPGCTLDALNAAAALHGLWFGPDVSSSAWATIGGMIGNNACGARSLRYGKTSDHLRALQLIDAEGQSFRWERGTVPGALRSVLPTLEVAREQIERAYLPLPRRVAGYALDRLLSAPDDPGGFAGSEGTLAILERATVKLERRPSSVLAIACIATSRDSALELVVELRACNPDSAEVIDDEILRMARSSDDLSSAASWVPPDAGAVVFCEFFGEDAVSRCAEASRMALVSGASVVPLEESLRAKAWSLRRAGLPLLTRLEGARRPVSLIEDLAVPPDAVPAFVVAIDELLRDANTEAVFYAHAAAGCLHIRPRFDLSDPEERAVALAVQRDAVQLAVSFGGTSTGEHGDGRARSHLLGEVYPPEILALFEVVKNAFDPHRRLNPGIIAFPDEVTVGFTSDRAGEERAKAVLAGARGTT